MKIKNVHISKLNFSLLISTAVLIILTCILLILLAGRKAAVRGDTGDVTEAVETTTALPEPSASGGETASVYETNSFGEDTTEPVSTLSFNIGGSGSVSVRPTYINADISAVTYWDSSNVACTQFRVIIKNVSGSAINNWGLAIEFDKKAELLDYWNSNMEADGANIKITPLPSNQKIGKTEQFEAGFIVSCDRQVRPLSYKVTIGSNVEQIKLNGVYLPETTTTYNIPYITTSGYDMTTSCGNTTTPYRNTTTPYRNTTTPYRNTMPYRDTTTYDRGTTTRDMTTSGSDMTTSGRKETTPGKDATNSDVTTKKTSQTTAPDNEKTTKEDMTTQAISE